jgi:hypothetical protein
MIQVTGKNHYGQKCIKCKSDLFQANENYIVKRYDNHVLFILATPLYGGQTYKCDKYKRFFITIDIPLGTHEIDEDSTTDNIIINYQ